MVRVLVIRGEESGGAVVLDLEGNTKTFSLESSINGEELYSLLDFKENAQYTVDDQGCGGVSKRPYESFVKLIKRIVDELNKLEEELKTPGFIENDNSQPPAFDEDIPF